mmetsp:Transcript_6553/g.12095  ORF Transcript_6553/g.12095 Transcript_6553/m.12095 type:complete len:98 (-) Transcript_6553:90-383(-)
MHGTAMWEIEGAPTLEILLFFVTTRWENSDVRFMLGWILPISVVHQCSCSQSVEHLIRSCSHELDLQIFEQTVPAQQYTHNPDKNQLGTGSYSGSWT